MEVKNGNPGRYQATPLALSDGAGSALLLDQYGRVVTTGGVTPTVNANTPAVASAATALAANTNRKGWMIQNLGQNPLFVKLGAGASTSEFHAVLKAGTANDDGLGGSFSQTEGAVFTGIISIAGTSPRYVVTEL